MQSMASFVAQNVGAGQEMRARKSMVTGMFIGGSIGIFIAVFSFLRGDLLASVFANDTAVIACATIFGIVINLIYFIVVSRENKMSASY